MSASQRYTHAPRQTPNLILGAFHLLFWLLFHPSAWRNHIARLDPDLPPDFTLLGLRRDQWRRPEIRRLLLQIYLVLPLCASLIVFLFFWLRGMPWLALPPNWLHFTAVALVASLLWGAAVSVAAGLVGGLLMGLLIPIASELLRYPFISDVTVYNMAIGLTIGLAASVTPILKPQSKRPGSGWFVGSVTIGLIVAAALIGLRYLLENVGRVAGLPDNVAYAVGRSLQVGLSFGVPAVWLWPGRRKWVAGLGIGVAAALLYISVYLITGSGAPVLARGLTSGVLFSLSLTASFALPHFLAAYLGGLWAGALAGALSSYGRHISFAYVMRDGVPVWPNIPSGFIAMGAGLLVSWWRPVLLYPFTAAWNLILYQLDLRRKDGPRLLRWQSAFWDEGQYLPLYGLYDHLLLTIEHDPAEGEAALAFLAASRQRPVAQAIQLELDARRLAACAGVMAIRAIHQHLGREPFSDSQTAVFLHTFSQISRDVDAALNQTTAYNQRQALLAVSERLDLLLRQLRQSGAAYAPRFDQIANRWQRIVADRMQELTLVSETRQEINSPYVIGMPLSAQQEIFVGRRNISLDIERFVLTPNCPPLFLYGQRRMGKTSLLNNLGRLLPSSILPLFVDLQGPASWASDHAGLLYSLAQAMTLSAQWQRNLQLPYLSRELLAGDPFVYFVEWLNEVEQRLTAEGLHTILLALDEFEALDDALNKGRFEETAVLGLLRHIIQHRPRFKLLLAGSHSLAEFQRWASYLINARLLHLDYLGESEARRLIERPIAEFSLRYEPAASQRALTLTRGHPFLVQLLCHEIVALKNQQEPARRRLAQLEDVEAAVAQALAHGDFYFADIYYNRVDAAGLDVLNRLAAQGGDGRLTATDLAGEGTAVSDLEQTLTQLCQRELIEKQNGGYRFQVELVRRWFAQAQR